MTEEEWQDREAHLLNDHHIVCNKTIRCIEEQLVLLKGGLSALRGGSLGRNPIKLHVTDDHLERAVDSLTAQLNHLYTHLGYDPTN